MLDGCQATKPGLSPSLITFLHNEKLLWQSSILVENTEIEITAQQFSLICVS
jgi:hypothetical protein